jgi:hypothetical protein
LFVDDQKAFLRSQTFLGRIKAQWPLLSGLIGVIVGWLLSSWHPFAPKQNTLRPADLPTAQSQSARANAPYECNVIHVRPRGGGWECYECEAVRPRFHNKEQAVDYAEHRARL